MSIVVGRAIERNRPRLIRLIPALVVIAILAIAGAAAAGWFGLVVVGLIGLVTISMLLNVDLPWGGAVPLGGALIIALTELLTFSQFVTVVALGLLAGWPVQRQRHGALRATAMLLISAVAAFSSKLAFRAAVLWIPGLDRGDGSDHFAILGRILIAGTVYLLIDLFVRARYLENRSHGVTWKEALPIYGTLVCAAALLAIAERKSGVAASFVAAIPLLVTRYSFQRYRVARTTYQQTTQALAIIPEIAGLTPLGHSERSAVYARALAAHLDLDPDEVDRVVTATRLQHIGHISLNDPEARTDVPDPVELGHIGAEILRETGFLDDVAQLVEQVQTGHIKKSDEMDASIVRVASTFDGLVENRSVDAHEAVVELQTLHPKGMERRVAIEMAALIYRRPGLVDEARQAAEPFTQAARNPLEASPAGLKP